MPLNSTTSLTAPTTTQPLVTPTTVNPDAACQNGQITVSQLNGSGAGGTFYEVLGFLNHSQTLCTLTGYPGVATLNAQGNQVLQAQRRPYANGAIIQAVKVMPGQTVSATVAASDTPYGTETSCVRFPAILVTPPGLTVSQTINFGDSTEAFPGCGVPNVYPVDPGTTGGQ
jgi:hypothetical protein